MSAFMLILTTKLYLPPARPDLVPRPRLTSRLADGLTRPLTLLSASAGFGKTTLVSELRAWPGCEHFVRQSYSTVTFLRPYNLGDFDCFLLPINRA